MTRPKVVKCEYCGEDLQNSRAGFQRKYHVDCARKKRADTIRQRRAESEELREYGRTSSKKRRQRIKADPQKREHEREMQRLRQARYRAKAQLHDENQRELLKARIELAKSQDALIEAASLVNKGFAEHERRIAALEQALADKDGDVGEALAEVLRPVQPVYQGLLEKRSGMKQ